MNVQQDITVHVRLLHVILCVVRTIVQLAGYVYLGRAVQLGHQFLSHARVDITVYLGLSLVNVHLVISALRFVGLHLNFCIQS